MDYGTESLRMHKKFRGKIEITGKIRVQDKDNLSVAYTPGVGKVASYVAENPSAAYEYTIKANTIAVVSDGSAVLGLGNIGPLGALPIMEGKALLFKEFAGIDAYPIVLNTQDPEQIVEVVEAISPTFAGINLEDISAPRCFEIEQRLTERLPIPVFHDDQHGTAIVTLAGLINALKITDRDIAGTKVVINGVGAAGAAIARLLNAYGFKRLVLVDSRGVINSQRQDLVGYKKQLLSSIGYDPVGMRTLSDALSSADVFIGVSVGGILTPDMVKRMAPKPIIFAMANPIPEIFPEDALEAGAAVVATGRSDYPNQINNVLVFPGIFRGALDYRVNKITTEMKLEAAKALARLVDVPSADKIIPDPFDKRVVPAVADAVGKYAGH